MALNPESGGGTRGGWRPGAGRPAGSSNKRTRQTQELLEGMGCNPIEAMAKIAMDNSTPLEIRAAMYRDLAGYFAPKLKAIDINANVQSELRVIRRVFTQGDPALINQIAPEHQAAIQAALDEEVDADEEEQEDA